MAGKAFLENFLVFGIQHLRLQDVATVTLVSRQFRAKLAFYISQWSLSHKSDERLAAKIMDLYNNEQLSPDVLPYIKNYEDHLFLFDTLRSYALSLQTEIKMSKKETCETLRRRNVFHMIPELFESTLFTDVDTIICIDCNRFIDPWTPLKVFYCLTLQNYAGWFDNGEGPEWYFKQVCNHYLPEDVIEWTLKECLAKGVIDDFLMENIKQNLDLFRSA